MASARRLSSQALQKDLLGPGSPGFKPGTVLLLITLEYAQECMAGPPFSVAEAEVRALYQGAEVTLWSRTEVLSENPRFAAKGLDSLNESVYRIIL